MPWFESIDFLAALDAMCLRGALMPWPFLAVCLVLAISSSFCHYGGSLLIKGRPAFRGLKLKSMRIKKT